MGITESVEVASSPQEGLKVGYHVLRVKQGSPADQAGFEAYFDYIVAVDGKRLLQQDATLINALRENEDKKCSVVLYSSKYQGYREVFIVPTMSWGGDGILGCSIRFCSYEHAAENVWHVLDVYDNGPASKAGFKAFYDYIIGTPVQVIRNKNDLFALVEYHMGKELVFYVYNWETDKVREVIIVPDSNWGGEGALGCDIGFGYLHRIPNRQSRPTGASTLDLSSFTASNGGTNGEVAYQQLKFETPLNEVSEKSEPNGNVVLMGEQNVDPVVNMPKKRLSESNLMEASDSLNSLPDVVTKTANTTSHMPVSNDFTPVELNAAK